MPSPMRVAEILGGEYLKKRVRTSSDLARAVEAGLPSASVRRVSEYVGRTSRERSSVEAIMVSRATLERRLKARQTLSIEESERAERMARLIALAEEVLESRDDAREFMHAPHDLLGHKAPVALARTDLGARQVEGLLWKIEYSLPV